MSQLLVGARGIDFYTGYPDLAAVRADGRSFVSFYTKYWRPDYAKRALDIGLGVLPISEHGQTAAMNGAPRGTSDAQDAVKQAKAAGIPAGVGIIMCHDTGQWDPVKVPAYFVAAEHVLRSEGYGNWLYGQKWVVDGIRAAGGTIDGIVSPAATSWQGGRHPDSHIWQTPSRVMYGVPVDPLTVQRTVTVWGREIPPTVTIAQPLPIVEEPPMIVTNSETRHDTFTNQDYPAHVFVFIVDEHTGTIRQVDGRTPEARLYAIAGATPAFSNAELDAWPKTVVPGPAPTHLMISGTINATGTIN